MKIAFVISGVTIGLAHTVQDSCVTATGPDGSTSHELSDDSPVDVGWLYADGQFSPPPATPPRVGPIRFQMLFTPAEAAKAEELRASDPQLAVFWKLIDDPRTDVVDLSLPSVQAAVEYTLTQVNAHGVAVDVQARKAAILTGVLQ